MGFSALRPEPVPSGPLGNLFVNTLANSWFFFFCPTQLPAPSLKSYLPWHKGDTPYGPPRPATGGVVGWFNAQIRKFKNRSNRSAAGAYEPSYGGGGAAGTGPRGFGPLDPDEAWDARVGTEADTYGYYEEELTGRDNEYSGGSYNMSLAATPGRDVRDSHDDDLERGRQSSRSPARATRDTNPFDDDNAESLRGVSPRPMDNPQPGRGR